MENKPEKREKLEILSFRGYLYAKQGKYELAREDLLKSQKSDNPKVHSKSLIVLAEIERKIPITIKKKEITAPYQLSGR